MKNRVYNPLAKLVLVLMLFIASTAIAQTTPGQKAKTQPGINLSNKATATETKKNDKRAALNVSPYNNGTNVPPAKAQKAAEKANTGTRSGKVVAPSNGTTATSTTNRAGTASTGTRKVANKNTTTLSSLVKTPKTKAATPEKYKTSATYTNQAPLSREAQLEASIGDIDAKLVKAKGTAAETDLIARRSVYQKELNEIKAKSVNEKKN